MRSRLLGRLGENVRRQDPVAIFVDLLILVLGVFLGIQAANWNEARQQRGEERRYYVQLLGDLRTDLKTLDTAVERSRTNDRAAERALALLDGAPPPAGADARWAGDFIQGGFLYLPRPARRTFDELISTGNLGLLRDSEAKAAIFGYYAFWEEGRQWDQLLRGQQQDYWRATAGLLPRRLQSLIFTRAPETVTPEEAKRIVAEARRRPELRKLLISMAAHQARVRRDSILQRREAEALIDRLTPLAGQSASPSLPKGRL